MNGKMVKFVKSNYLLFVGLGVLAACCISDSLGSLSLRYYYDQGRGFLLLSAAAVLGAIVQVCLNYNSFTQNRLRIRRGKNPCQWKNRLGNFTWTKSPQADGICAAAVGICWLVSVWVWDGLALLVNIVFSLFYGTIDSSIESAFQNGIQLALYITPYGFGFFHLISAFLVTKAVLGYLLEPVPRKAAASDMIQV